MFLFLRHFRLSERKGVFNFVQRGKEKFMKRKATHFLIAIFAVGAFCLSGAMATSVAAQAAQDFTLVNRTGVEIYALFVTPHDVDDWGEDILGQDTLAVGQTLDISFSRKEKAAFWDLRIEDSDGNFIEWESLNLTAIDTLTLFYNNKKATATFTEKDWNLAGIWVGYYDDGTKSPYRWKITQNGSTLSITDARGGKTKSRGSVSGSNVTALDFATQKGKVSADGTRIVWSDGVVWVRQ